MVALATGAAEVRPCLDAAEARKRAELLGPGLCLLGGEERGYRIPGFALGNSPLEYRDPKMVAGKTICLATTNGTAAIRRAYAKSGAPVYIGALVNVSAVARVMVEEAVAGAARCVALVCSGQDSHPAAEDLYCAGLIARQVDEGLRHAGMTPCLGDGAWSAAEFAAANQGRPLEVLAASEHGRYLQAIGFGEDLKFSSQLDVYSVVPVFDGTRVAPRQGR